MNDEPKDNLELPLIQKRRKSENIPSQTNIGISIQRPPKKVYKYCFFFSIFFLMFISRKLAVDSTFASVFKLV